MVQVVLQYIRLWDMLHGFHLSDQPDMFILMWSSLWGELILRVWTASGRFKHLVGAASLVGLFYMVVVGPRIGCIIMA
jgi:hypothetical protein